MKSLNRRKRFLYECIDRMQNELMTDECIEIFKRSINDLNTLDVEEKYNFLKTLKSSHRKQILQQLVKYGFNVNEYNYERTLLSYVTLNNKKDFVKLLLSMDGIDVNQPDHQKRTPIMYAYNTEIAKMLISAGANIDQQDYEDWTALMLASGNGDKDIVELLLANGADMYLTNEENKTAEDLAREEGHNEIIQIFTDMKSHS